MSEPFERRSQLQAVETCTGLVLGVLIYVVVTVGAWLVTGWLDLVDPVRSQVSVWAQVVGVVVGVAVLVWWLVRARRRGL